MSKKKFIDPQICGDCEEEDCFGCELTCRDDDDDDETPGMGEGKAQSSNVINLSKLWCERKSEKRY